MQLQPKLQLKPQALPIPGAKQFHTDPRYHILQSRSASLSSYTFLYGVQSTKIYCVPTCTARLARRANVVFFNTAQDARRDGFRPCKRCRPDEGGFRGRGEEVVARVISLATMRELDDGSEVDRERMGLKGVSDLAREVGVSPSYLSRVFKRVMGVTVGEYLVEFERGESNAMETETSTSTVISEYGPMSSIGTEDIQEASDFADFDLDDWFWAGEYLHGTRDVQAL
ncbi:metal binding domain of Ada-domain-containing protein [Aspergillus keveii]|uniref:Metal binding domain of Ada-domain-containing protein n=1 Tax=Aspergillus keveii TaxID=714993 RepID=A0ABR4FMC5_9EURO